MTDQDDLTPRVFIVRHGETEWAKSGRFTSFTEIDLTPTGIAQVSSSSTLFVGNGKLIDPCRLVHIFASPRVRTRTTLKLLLESSMELSEEQVTFTDDITEWNYGIYEGLKKDEIRSLRKMNGLDKDGEWDVWSSGCEGGETVEQVTRRLDRLISEIKDIQKPYMYGTKPADIVLIAHGLILRCFVKRWLGDRIGDGFSMMLDPGAVGVLSYKNNNIEEPALHVGVRVPV